MAHPFSETERHEIRKRIMAEAYRLFSNGGAAAVSLSRVTGAAGIAKTSFYAFFPSKEALLLDLLAEEAPGVSARVMAPLQDSSCPARDALTRFLSALLREYETNPFLARLVTEPETLNVIARRVRPEDLARKSVWMEEPLRAFFQSRMRTGEIVAMPLETALDLVRSVSLLSLHRDRFGSAARFEAAAEALIDFVSGGFTRKEPDT